jgi:hypothetical protein
MAAVHNQNDGMWPFPRRHANHPFKPHRHVSEAAIFCELFLQDSRFA